VAHDHHFLERLDRVPRARADFALGLYRDHEAIAYVLSHVNLPPSATRVALALDGGDDAPVILVTRDGHFVTCLGAGMRYDQPLVPHGQLVALLGKVKEKRARRELAQQELRADEEEGDLFQRLLTRGSRVAREDFLAVSSFEPLLGLAPFLALLDLGDQAVHLRASLHPTLDKMVVNGATTKVLEKLHRMEWATAHLALLSGSAERQELDRFLASQAKIRYSPSVCCSLQGGSVFFLRSAWMAARFGKMVIPAYKAAFVDSKDSMSLLDATCGLAAIGIRHSGTTAEIRRFFDAQGLPTNDAPNLLEGLRRHFAREMFERMKHVDEQIESTVKIGRHLVARYGERLPEGHPLRHREEDVPPELAKTAALAFDGDLLAPELDGYLFTVLPAAARADAADFFFPREAVRRYFGQWSPEETLIRLQRGKQREKKPEPVKSGASPGRNEPCSCGSGKKWKKCHGAPS
jgi:hypothetical protein